MKLSPNFTYEEMIRSQTAESLGIDNTPPDEALQALTTLLNEVLEKVRAHFGKPITPSSGYRSPELNKALEKKGASPTSQHMKGQAVDFRVPGVDNLTVAEWIRDNCDFDQIILEYYDPENTEKGWVHVSYVGPEVNRREVLTKGPKFYMKGFPKRVCPDTGYAVSVL